jgi:small-conductance mechanosensitive channel
MASIREVVDWIAQAASRLGESGPVGAGIALAIVVGSLLIIMLVFGLLDRKLQSWQGAQLRSLTWQRQQLLSREDTAHILRGAVRWVKYAAYLVLVLLAIQLLFLALPDTRPIGTWVMEAVLGIFGSVALGFFGYLPSVVFLVVLYFLTAYGVKFTRLVFQGIRVGRIEVAGFEPEWAMPTFKIIRLLIWAFALVIAFPYLPGSGSPAFQGVSIFLGVLLSLGGSASMANVVSGVVLTYTNAFRVGDRVRIANVTGDVLERTLFVTRLRTPKQEAVTIPNAKVLANETINYSSTARSDGVMLHTTVTLGYDVEWRTVHEAMIEAALATEGIENEPAPFVLQTALGDFYVHYEINALTKDAAAMPATYSRLHQNLQDKLHGAGIEIASPHLAAIRDGNHANIPDKDLRDDYEAGAFRVFPWQPAGTD